MNAHDILRLFPNASQSTLRANVSAGGSRKAPKLERPARDGAVGQIQIQAGARPDFLIRVTAIRSRLLDDDNLAEKYHVDLCRYAGIIPDDCPGKTKIEVGQRKAEKGESERVIIEVFELGQRTRPLKTEDE